MQPHVSAAAMSPAPAAEQREQPQAAAQQHDQCEGVWGSARAHEPLMQVFLRLPADARARAASVCRVWEDAAADRTLPSAARCSSAAAALP